MTGLIPVKLPMCSEKLWMCRHWDVASPVLGQGGVHRSLCKDTAMAGLAELQVLVDIETSVDVCSLAVIMASGYGETSWRESKIKVN